MTAPAVVLIVLALVLFLAEAHLSSGGLIGIAASAAAVGGIVLLLVAAGASTWVVLIVPLCAAVVLVSLLLLARRRIFGAMLGRPRTGREALVGHVGTVRSATGAQAEVFVEGSLWRAEPSSHEREGDLQVGDRVVVERIDGLTLGVRKAEQWELSR
jgi:membrane protein implicated in regulation of membrane protease activity